MWDRQRILGYGHLQLPCSPGTTHHTIRTWRPALTQIGRLRSFFIGGTPELRDLTFAGVPTTLQQSTLRYIARAAKCDALLLFSCALLLLCVLVCEIWSKLVSKQLLNRHSKVPGM